MNSTRFLADTAWTAAIVATALLAAAVLVVVGGIPQLPGTDPVASDAARIDSCETITAPGRYVLTTNLSNSSADRCLRIRDDDVTLDGRGHAIDGVGAFGSGGVLVEGRSNVTVSNVTVTDWDDGIRYIDVDGGTITGTTTARNRVGVTLLSSSDNTVSNNTATANTVYGISLQEASRDNTVTGNDATANSLFGIHLVRAEATNNTVRSNTASDNEYGIVLIGATDNVVRDNDAAGNRIAGVWLSEADGNRVVGNTVSNRFYGIYLGDGSEGNIVRANTAVENAVGIRLIHSDRNHVAANTAAENGAEGVLLLASDSNVILDNVLPGNRQAIVVARSENVTRSNNSASAG